MLGHTNVSQTSTYLNATRVGLQESMRRFDDSASRRNPVAKNAQTDPLPLGNEQSRNVDQVVVN
jgi:hypothetical protein